VTLGVLTLVLASASPRRRELLARLGLEVTVVAPRVNESPVAGEPPPDRKSVV
jgi:septum formation protein